MAKSKTTRILIGLPSYKGPHKWCFDNHYEMMYRLGRLAEREPHRFEFNLCSEVGNSQIGQARDRLCQAALDQDMDYVLFWDDDMRFPTDSFERLLAHKKPVIGCLAFTARQPITPVLYRFTRGWDFKDRRNRIDIYPIFRYERDSLVKVDGLGSAMLLIKTSVFRTIPKPWFYGHINCGEDIHFAVQCYENNIPIFCDTSLKAQHYPNEVSQWHDEDMFLSRIDEIEENYVHPEPDDRNPNVQQRFAAV